MRKFIALTAFLTAAPLAAQAPSAAPPRLLVVISVDQLSADLFAGYRRHFTGGLARLQQGAVFPSGYQAQSATETCPGHATITTGVYPGRAGIIANDWIDLNTARKDKTVYCAEDERVAGSTSGNYTVSDVHLLVPTLGERMKVAYPASRTVSVAGKDRAAVMMAGHKGDQVWWWSGKAYATYAGRATPPVVDRANAAIAARLAAAQPALDVPELCRSRDRAVAIGGGKTVGTVRFARAAGDTRAFRASPESDGATFALAAGLIEDMKLGQGSAPDIISIGASATDYVGHTYGTEGVEMCLQLLSLDRDMGDFFNLLDARGIDYAVALTADHGGHDLPERTSEDGVPATRVDRGLNTATIGKAIAAKLGLTGQLLWGGSFGDVWIDPKLTPAQRAMVQAEAIRAYATHPQVQAVMTKAQVAATPIAKSPPESWSLLERARASFHPARSGDLIVALKPRVTPIVDPTGGYVATHGSFWDYDRRVPMLFWRKGMVGYEQPLSVGTVDIAPTLAALIGLPIPAAEIDGRCLDLVAGVGSSCP